MCSNCAKHVILNKVKGVYCKGSEDPTFKQRWNNSEARMVLKNMKVEYTEI